MTPARALRRFGPVVLIACLLVAVVATGDWRRLSLTQLASHRQALTLMVAHRPMMSLLIFVGIFTAVVVACTPGPGVMAVAGGFLFGPWLGGAASLVSFTLGASLVFLACRTAFGDWAINRAGPLARRIEAGFSANAFSYLLTLRLIPIVPFFVTNIAAGLARVRLRDLVLATWIGSAPVSFVLGDLGAGLGGLFDRGVTTDGGLLLRPQILLPLSALALLSAGPIAWRVVRSRRQG